MTFDISKITIPTNPGIYLMKDSDDKIIYIGKAKNLKNRVRSYFNKNQNYKTQKLVENISDIEFVLTDNESCLLYTSPSPRDLSTSRMPSSA